MDQNLDSFENKLKADIESGLIEYLILAKEEKVGGRDVQLYSIGNTENVAAEDDDIPF